MPEPDHPPPDREQQWRVAVETAVNDHAAKLNVLEVCVMFLALQHAITTPDWEFTIDDMHSSILTAILAARGGGAAPDPALRAAMESYAMTIFEAIKAVGRGHEVKDKPE